ncbi:hypothetical protein BpHYR1_030629 [Brachionus plicatilis]|uniref:Transmembrane protein n=1 Tax=Brachionus plicatilis TaxID=10195 RepID=A0A3M7RDE1_BRAPC|nr:hypothetical protein BpHYR1_030629 [Brachionus plicatilis]
MEPKETQITMDSNPPPDYTAAMSTPQSQENESPPSYNSLFSQLQRAREKSSNPGDYALRACGIICGSLFITIFFAISSAIPIAMIVIGAIYKDDCPIDNRIPIWLIVSGVFGLLSTLIRTTQNCYAMFKKRNNEENTETQKKNFLVSIIELFIFVWFICGNFWVYSVKSVVSDDPLSAGYSSAYFVAVAAAYLF